MAIYMTTNIDCHRKSCDMSWISINIDSKSCGGSSQSSRTDSKTIDFFQHFYL